MQLSFQFADFFRDRRDDGGASPSGLRKPTFLVQTGVTGHLKIEDLKEDLLNDDQARIEVTLEGFMKTELETSVGNHSQVRLNTEKKLLSMTQALSLQGHTKNAPSNERHYPFNFDVASWIRHDQKTSAHHRDMASKNHFAAIPPSLWHEIKTPPNAVWRPRAAARVTYQLTARLVRDHKILAQIRQPIILLASQTPSPPTCIADFKGEYRTVQKSVLRTSLRKKAGELSVIVQEPKQLTTKASGDELVVELPVKLRLKRTRQELSSGQPSYVKAEVKWQFQYSTFVSVLEQQGPPSLQQALCSPATAFVRSTLDSKTVDMAWRHWKPLESGPENSMNMIESEQSLWLRLPPTEVLTPTFWSPFLSRRYSILLQLKILQPGSARIEVEVPIQVGIEAESPTSYEQSLLAGHRTIDEMILDNAEGDELLPQYGTWD